MRILFVALLSLCWVLPVNAAGSTKAELNSKVQATLTSFYSRIPNARQHAENAVAMLVFPEIAKAGFILGGEFGEGALLVNGETVDYYSAAGGSVGFQVGVQVRSQVVIFRSQDSFNRFRRGEGWEVGVDGSVAVATEGAGGKADSKSINQPVVAFIFANKGLMANVSLEGTKFTRINK